MKKISSFIATCLIIFIVIPAIPPLTTHAYSSDVHEYLTEEALKFLKTKNSEAYDEMSLYLYDLRKGAYDEDAIGPELNEKIDTYWRPFRHFYRITDGLGYLDGGERSVSSLLNDPNTSSDFANLNLYFNDSVLADAPDNRRYPNAYEWASGNEPLNKHDFQDAIDAYKAGNKKEAYYTLGFVLHLIEDMSVPEHTQLESHNDDPFPTGGLEEGSGYEQFITDKYSGVSEDNCSSNKLRNYLHPFCTPPGVEDTFHAKSVEPVFSYYDDVLSDYSNLKQYFDSMATLGYYRNRFQANLNSTTGTATGELADMFEISHVSDNTWMIFSDIGLWSGGDTVKTTDTWWETTKFDGNPDAPGWYYIENSYNKLDLQGKTKPEIYKKDWYNYAENEIKKSPSLRFKTPYTGDYVQNTEGKVLADVMAEDLIPLSVQHAAGVMDLFWRETRSVEYGALTLEVNGEALSLPSYTDFGDVVVGSSKTYTFTIRNNADGVLFIASPAELTSGDIDQFEVINGSSNQYLDKEESTTFQIKYKPTSTGDKVAGLTLNSSDGLKLFNVEGAGVGIELAPSVENPIAPSAKKSSSGIVSCYDLTNTEEEPIIGFGDGWTQGGGYDYGLTLIGRSKSHTIKIKNNSSDSITLKAETRWGINTDIEKFKIVNYSLGEAILPNTCVSFSVVYSPTSMEWDDLHIAVTGTGNTRSDISFGGIGIKDEGDYYLYMVMGKENVSFITQKFLLNGKVIGVPYTLTDDLIKSTRSIIMKDNRVDDPLVFLPPGTIIKIRKSAVVDKDFGSATYTTTFKYFTDTTTHWAKDYIDALYEKGIVKGRAENTFEPDATISRAELIKMTILATGLSTSTTGTQSTFADVSSNDWFSSYVEKAYSEGIIEGNMVDGKRYFRPNDPVVRAEALKILLYGAGKKSFDGTSTTNLFTDVRSTDWFYDLVAYAKNNNIVSGYPNGSFKPARQVTRAEASKILHVLFFESLALGPEPEDALESEPAETTSPESNSPDATIHVTSTGGDWGKPGTWVENRLPGINDIVEINSHVYVDNQLCSDATVQSLIIGTNGVVEPHNSGCITIKGDMVNDGTVNKSEDLSLIIEGDLTNSGSIEVTCMKVSGKITDKGTIKENPYCWSSI